MVGVHATDTRDRLLDAAKTLVWERGVEATSPNMLLARSGAGQGSLYHYFGSKQRWAAAAITALAADLTAETEQLFSDSAVGLPQVRAYLAKSRAALDGCRLGRLAFDPEVVADAALRAPITAFFDRLRELLGDALTRARQDGDLIENRSGAAVVEAICAVVQGGYVTARLSDDPDALARACQGLIDLLAPTDPGRTSR